MTLYFWTLFACGDAPYLMTPPVVEATPNVVLVTLDTTRADHLGAYGRVEARTPTLDGLASRGLRFDRAYSPVPLTIPSHATLMTGLDPHHHGVRDNGSAVLAPKHVTLAEHLGAAGWTSAASVSAFVTQARWGLCQGFEVCLDHLPPRTGSNQASWTLERPASSVVDDALSWWEGRDRQRPALLWVHFYDAHRPFNPPEPFLSEMKGLPYDAEIAAVDAELGRLEAVIAQDSRDTLWVVAGDHGEALGGHQEREHGWYVYNATQRVPLILAGAGLEPGVIEQPVGLVDVLPTVLKTLGLAVPEDLDGSPQPGQPHPLVLEAWSLLDQYGYAPHVGLVEGPWKLIDTPRPELYHQADDPRETEDRSAESPEIVARLQGILEGLGVTAPGEGESLDLDTLAALQALGYLGAASGVAREDAPDPKDRQGVLARIVRSEELQEQGQLAKAEVLLKNALELDPDALEVRLRLARLWANTGRTEQALAEVQSMVSSREASMAIWINGVSILGAAGDHTSALILSEQGLEHLPGDPGLQELMLISLLNLGRSEEASERALAWELEVASRPSLSALVGLSLARSGRALEARPWLQAGASADRVPRDVHLALAGFEARVEGAESLLLAELSDYPDNWEARLKLWMLVTRSGRYPEALGHAEALLRDDRDNPRSRHAHAQSLFNLGRFADCRDETEQAVAQWPQDPELWLLLANVQQKQGESELAARTFAHAKVLNKAATGP